MAKKVVRSFTKMADNLLENPKVQVTAKKDLRIPPVHLVGHLYALWSGTKKFAEDGDLSRFDDDMIAELAEYTGDPAKFVRTLQLRRWLDERLIHDWIDHQRDWLISKYKNRPHILKAIWAKHGRVYGRDDQEEEEEAGNGDDAPAPAGKSSGSSREVNGKSSGSNREAQEVEVEKELKTPNPVTQDQEEKKNSNKGGTGENAETPPGEPRVFSSSFSSSSRVQSFEPPSAREPPWEELSAAQVFEAFKTMFRMNGVSDHVEFQRLMSNAGVTPARWAMLFMDKIAYAYGKEDGRIRLDLRDINPVALTAAGFRPKRGGKQQEPTGSARGLFKEIFVDVTCDPEGRGKRWRIITGEGIARELEKRKGRHGGA